MPANVIASILFQTNKYFTLLGELVWKNWSIMRTSIVIIDKFSAVTLDNWHNIHRAGIGGRYQVTPHVLLQLGVSYDLSSTSIRKRLPDLPIDKQVRFGAGIQYSLTKILMF